MRGCWPAPFLFPLTKGRGLEQQAVLRGPFDVEDGGRGWAELSRPRKPLSCLYDVGNLRKRLGRGLWCDLGKLTRLPQVKGKITGAYV